MKGIKKGTIVVRTDNGLACCNSEYKEKGVIFKTTDNGYDYACYPGGAISNRDFRLATFIEIEAYNSGIRNIKYITSLFQIYF